MICKNKRCHRDIPEDAKFCPYCGKNQSPGARRRRKRGNGEGTVYKRSDVKSTPWVALTPARMDELGRMKPEKIGSYATEQEARDALMDFKAHPISRLSATVEDIYQEWLPIGTTGRTHHTLQIYQAAYKKLWSIKKRKFRDIRTADLQRIIDYYKEEHLELDENGKMILDKSGKPKKKDGLAFPTLSSIVTLLGCMYSYAIQNDIVIKDYSNFIILPPKPAPKKDYFTDIEFKKIENAVGIVPYADYIYIMCYTGHRVDEFMKLDAQHYDSKNKLLLGGNKTTAGKNKIVPVHPKIQPLVDECLARGGETLFCNKATGRPFHYEAFRAEYDKALKTIGVRPLTPHATRRTFATRCDEFGVSKSDIRALMGHSGEDIDDRHYINKTVERLQKAISQIA